MPITHFKSLCFRLTLFSSISCILPIACLPSSYPDFGLCPSISLALYSLFTPICSERLHPSELLRHPGTSLARSPQKVDAEPHSFSEDNTAEEREPIALHYHDSRHSIELRGSPNRHQITSPLSALPTIWPVHGRISSHFGKRPCPFPGKPRFHQGVDIAADKGEPVSAAAEGNVVSCGWYGGYGKSITLNHGSGYVTRYAHLKKIYVRAGQPVKKGEKIGTVGSTGRSTGPHLHYEVRFQGNPVDPERFLPAGSTDSLLCKGALSDDEHQPSPKGAGR